MSKHFKTLRLLEKVAETVPVIKSSRIASAIVIDGDVISLGVNSKKTHPLQARYSSEPESICLHAEIDAIKNALRHIRPEDFRRSTIYVLRYKFRDTSRKSSQWGLAKPCSGCARAIAAFGISKVVYTIDGDQEYAVA
jgi:deoxycytidylate deaminase